MNNSTTLLDGITINRLEQIEIDRNQTYSDPNFQLWVQELNVSASWHDNTPIYNAREAMQEWDSSRFRLKVPDNA